MPNIQKVERELQRLVSSMLQRDIKDKTISFVTITGVKVLKDLSKATIYYTVLGQDPKKAAVAKALDRAKGFIRSGVARKMKLRHTPELIFKYDESLEYGNKIENILKNL